MLDPERPCPGHAPPPQNADMSGQVCIQPHTSSPQTPTSTHTHAPEPPPGPWPAHVRLADPHSAPTAAALAPAVQMHAARAPRVQH
eukprot:1158086-Pelagomonas_calceolata.AAC.2